MYVFVWLPPKFTLPGEIMAHIVMLKRLVFTKRNKGEAVASPVGHWLGSSCHFPIHTLYQWHSSSSAFVCDRDQIDFQALSGHLQVWECEEGRVWIARANFGLITYSCVTSISTCLSSVCLPGSPSLTLSHTHTRTSLLLRNMKKKCLQPYTRTHTGWRYSIQLNNLPHISAKTLSSCNALLPQPMHYVQYFF